MYAFLGHYQEKYKKRCTCPVRPQDVGPQHCGLRGQWSECTQRCSEPQRPDRCGSVTQRLTDAVASTARIPLPLIDVDRFPARRVTDFEIAAVVTDFERLIDILPPLDGILGNGLKAFVAFLQPSASRGESGVSPITTRELARSTTGSKPSS